MFRVLDKLNAGYFSHSHEHCITFSSTPSHCTLKLIKPLNLS